ncbi:DUF2955 domain-containing protein [Vibrio paucivorans]
MTPWLVFVFGMLIDWPLSFVGAVFTSLFVLGKQQVPVKYAATLIIAAYGYMIAAWFVTGVIRPYPGAMLLIVIVAVSLSYYLLVTRNDILMVVMALLGALLIPLQMKSSPETAWELAIWLPHNLMIAWLVSYLMFSLLPAEPNEAPPSKKEAEYDANRRWLRLCVAFLPFVGFAFVTDNVSAFTLTYVSVQLTLFAASPTNGPTMIKDAMVGNIVGGAMAVAIYEISVIAPFLPLVIVVLLLAYLILANRMLNGDGLAPTALTALTVVCGVSLGPLMDDAEGKLAVRLMQIAASMGYIFIAMLAVDKWLPEKQTVS